MAEQRQAERLGLAAASGEVLVFQPMVIVDLSVAGMTVETSCALLVESLHEFRLAMGERKVVVKGRVVHSRISAVDRDVVTYVSGIEFAELSDRTAGAIAAFLATVAQHRDTFTS